jgi:DNA-binding NarL/FixJ family response regulator
VHSVIIGAIRDIMPRITVLLADDHTIIAQGLASLLSESFEVVGTASDGRELIELARKLKPVVIITDISMPLLNGLDAVNQLRSEGIQAKVIVLTQHKEPQFAVEAFRAGVSGYLLKQGAGEELVKAVQEVAQGRFYLTGLITRDLISVLLAARGKDSAAERSLTSRQREILQLIAEGRTAKEIAGILNISTRTVEGHKYEIMEALGVKTSAELVQQAIRLGLISP